MEKKDQQSLSSETILKIHGIWGNQEEISFLAAPQVTSPMDHLSLGIRKEDMIWKFHLRYTTTLPNMNSLYLQSKVCMINVWWLLRCCMWFLSVDASCSFKGSVFMELLVASGSRNPSLVDAIPSTHSSFQFKKLVSLYPTGKGPDCTIHMTLSRHYDDQHGWFFQYCCATCIPWGFPICETIFNFSKWLLMVWLGSFGCFPRSVCPTVYFFHLLHSYFRIRMH